MHGDYILCRFGGDEFLIMGTNENVTDVDVVKNKIVNDVKKNVKIIC